MSLKILLTENKDSLTDVASKQHSRKVHFDSHIDFSSPANTDFAKTDDFENQENSKTKFNTVLSREDQLQKLKNKAGYLISKIVVFLQFFLQVLIC